VQNYCEIQKGYELNILTLSPVHWSYLRQRYQHIALGLARKGYSVLYLQITHFDPNNVPVLFTILPSIKRIGERLSVLNIFIPVPFHNKPERVHDVFGLSFLKFYLRYLRFTPDVAIFGTPYFAFFLPFLKSMGTKIIYDCVDEMTAFPNVNNNLQASLMERYMVKNSTFTFAASKILYSKILKLNPNCFYVPNGVDFPHFFSASKVREKIPEVEHLKHSIVGYIGAVFEWFDVDLVCKLARLHPDYSILLVGPVDFSLKKKLEGYLNIKMVGAKPYEVLPRYLACMDVCLIPFKINRLTSASNPIKLYEYLAAGKPVVSTALPEVCENASGLVYIAKDSEDFIRKVEEAVKEAESPNKELIMRRIKFAKENSWEKRIETIEKLLRCG